MIKVQVFWDDNAVSTGKHLPTFRKIVLMAVTVYQSTGHKSKLQQHHSKNLKHRSLADLFLSSHFSVIFFFSFYRRFGRSYWWR